MNGRLRACMIVLIVAAGLAATARADDIYYVKREVKMKSSPTLSASTVATLKTQEKVNVLDKSGGRFWQVEASGQKGYVYSGWLTKSEGVDVKGALAAAASQQSRLSSSESSGAIRGLSAEAEAFAQGSAEVTAGVKEDLEWVQALSFKNELDQFLKEGKLGEYGGGN